MALVLFLRQTTHNMTILILGSGGREHTFAWKIAQSPLCETLYVAPGNSGTAQIATNIEIKVTDFKAIKDLVISKKIEMVVVGPEDPLVLGIHDYFLNDDDLKSIKTHQNIVLENLNLNINEKLIYTLFNIIDQDNKFLVTTSIKPVSEINFKLDDLRSRTKNCLLAKIEKPNDDLMFALILKNLSDRQIILDKKLINFIIKNVDRSY